jgi:hypothetical protein
MAADAENTAQMTPLLAATWLRVPLEEVQSNKGVPDDEGGEHDDQRPD